MVTDKHAVSRKRRITCQYGEDSKMVLYSNEENLCEIHFSEHYGSQSYIPEQLYDRKRTVKSNFSDVRLAVYLAQCMKL